MLREFVIQPNCSLTDTSRRNFLLSIGLVMFSISVGLALQGLWLVAPFMGADLLIVVYAFRCTSRNCKIIERVVITGDKLTIHHEEEQHPDSWSFSVYWVNVDLRPSQQRNHNTRLLIGTHGNWIELARFLNNDERASLTLAIRDAITAARQPA